MVSGWLFSGGGDDQFAGRRMLRCVFITGFAFNFDWDWRHLLGAINLFTLSSYHPVQEFFLFAVSERGLFT